MESNKTLGSIYCCFSKDEMVCPKYRNLGGIVVKAKPYAFSTFPPRLVPSLSSLLPMINEINKIERMDKICIDNHIVQSAPKGGSKQGQGSGTTATATATDCLSYALADHTHYFTTLCLTRKSRYLHLIDLSQQIIINTYLSRKVERYSLYLHRYHGKKNLEQKSRLLRFEICEIFFPYVVWGGG